jgi:hypothetical protein
VAEKRSSLDPVTVAATSKGGRALAIVPVAVALLVGALTVPRAAIPDAVPLPAVDTRALRRTAEADRAVAEGARRERLPGEVRALGSAVRDFNARQAKGLDQQGIADARRALDAALGPALAAGPGKVAALRALQLEGFLAELRRFEATGEESEELVALGGAFVRRARDAGWISAKNAVALDDAQRRVSFKLTWNALVGVDRQPELRAGLDEMRALYTLYLEHPHAPEAIRAQIARARGVTQTPESCARLAAREKLAMEGWRLEKIQALGAIDPAYPTGYAVGVAQFQLGQFVASSEAFRGWLAAHPDGPYALRARNFMKGALVAAAP